MQKSQVTRSHEVKFLTFRRSVALTSWLGAAVRPKRVAQAAFLLALAFSAYFFFLSLNEPIIERHGFRQTQTALTAFYFIRGGFRLDYWTPVIGQNWSIPFEFPIYQGLVAAIVKLTGVPLEPAGRTVSWSFMLACCRPLYRIVRETGHSTTVGYLCLGLLLSAPVYAFWASTFMIETAALYFSLEFALRAVRIVSGHSRLRDYFIGGAFLTLALLQKLTTPFPIAVLFSALVAINFLRSRLRREKWLEVAMAAAMIIVPGAIGIAWIRYSDIIKSQNPIGSLLVSSSMTAWNFGTLEERLSEQLWLKVLLDRVFGVSVFGAVGLAIIIAGLVSADRERRRQIVIAAVAGLLPFLIFTNLQIVHDYYQMSATIFFLAAVGLSVGVVCENVLPKRPLLQAVAMISLLFANFASFETSYAGDRHLTITTSTNRTLMLSDFIKNHTREDDVVVWFGFDWSSEAAFYSQRKSLTAPAWGDFEMDAIANTAHYLDRQPAAIVLCPTPNRDRLLAAIRAKYGSASSRDIDSCKVFLLTSS
jgi:hypothetical protein